MNLLSSKTIIRYLSESIDKLLNILIFYLSGLSRRNSNRLIFGSWMGHKYADNPKYLVEYLLTRDECFDIFWCGRKEVCDQVPNHTRLHFVEYGSFKSILAILTSKFCFVDHGFRDLFRYNMTRGAISIYLGHGMTLKNMGARDRDPGKGWLSYLRKLNRNSGSYTFYICSSEEHKDKLIEEYDGASSVRENVLPTGQPRNDCLVNKQNDNHALRSMKNEFCKIHCIPDDRKLITYLPTFRDNRPEGFSFRELKEGHHRKIYNILEGLNAFIIEKKHFVDGTLRHSATSFVKQSIMILDDRAGIDTQKLMIISDLLITDYSGCYFDFLLLDRPIIHFVYDLEFYTSEDRGLYYNFEDVAGGDIVSTFEALCTAISENLQHPESNSGLRRDLKNKMLMYERGVSSRQIFERLLKNRG